MENFFKDWYIILPDTKKSLLETENLIILLRDIIYIAVVVYAIKNPIETMVIAIILLSVGYYISILDDKKQQEIINQNEEQITHKIPPVESFKETYKFLDPWAALNSGKYLSTKTTNQLSQIVRPNNDVKYLKKTKTSIHDPFDKKINNRQLEGISNVLKDQYDRRVRNNHGKFYNGRPMKVSDKTQKWIDYNSWRGERLFSVKKGY
ncbi:MAG: hypothetical protein ACOCRK_01150 [bacterium]